MQRELVDTAGRPVIYAGRFADQVTGLPDDRVVLGDWDVLFHKLAEVLEGADAVVVLDSLSFPFEMVAGNRPDVPLIVALPEADAGFLTAVFGGPLFDRAGFFDRFVVGDDFVWRELRRRYGWAEGQRFGVEGREREQIAAEVYASLMAESTPYLTHDKAVHRVQAAALEPQFAAARQNRDEGVPLEVLEVGAGAGRWAASFDPSRTRFVGADASGEMVRAARANFPELRFDPLDADQELPYEDECFDLAFTVDVLHRNLPEARRRLLSEMWRVTRPGGRLTFLEDFVDGRPSGPEHVTSVLPFVEVLLGATGGQVVLEHVESLRYPHDDVFRGGLISVSRLGVPRRW